MLSVGKIRAGPRAARYYTDQVARGRDDYYASEGEEPGTWVGSGAAMELVDASGSLSGYVKEWAEERRSQWSCPGPAAIGSS